MRIGPTWLNGWIASNQLYLSSGIADAICGGTMVSTSDRVSSAQLACVHCGTFFSSTGSARFCCAGCEFVYGLIQSNGLNHFYSLKAENPPVCPVPAVTSNSNFAFCDEPEFFKNLSPDGTKLRFYLEGMNCTACLWLLEKLPAFCSDAQHARVDMSASTIEVTRAPNGSFAEIARTLNRFGYRPHPLSQTESSVELQAREHRQDLVRIGIAGALTGNIMILAVSIYSGATGELANQFRWLSAVLAAPVLTYCAWPFYRSVISAVKSKHLNLDVPIVLAILAGVASSVWSLVASADRIYFDSLSMLVLLLLSSRLILKRIQNNQMRSVNLENEMLLGSVWRAVHGGSRELVSSLALSVGDHISVEEDRTVPVDGFVVSGEGTISVAVLTGESQPQKVQVGDYVEAGSHTLSGDWVLKVKNLPSQTRLAQILRDTETSSKEKSSFVKSADRVGTWFLSSVLFASVIVVAHFASTDLAEGVSRALALLIVTCPCVFGIAIPLSMSMAIRGAAKNGIIVKSGNSIERLWSARTLVFDKTGTLTTGAMAVLGVDTAAGIDLSFALGLEQNQTHPVARAITSYLKHRRIFPAHFNQVIQLASGGVAGEVDGVTYQISPISRSAPTPINKVLQTDIGFFKNGELIATFVLGDGLRTDARSLISWARSEGFAVALVSGDQNGVVRSCAEQVGFRNIEVYSQASPEQKAALVGSFGRGVVMVGDGVNDAIALAKADTGIAVCGSLDVSLRAADIYLTRSHLTLIPKLISIVRMTKFAIFRNLVFSASFNLVSGGMAIMGLMTPLWAAVLMPLSSLTVLLSALWTGKKIAMVKDQ